ncbi:hypothetical protein BV22DRAFT_580619 [Leucogyrophana mollusca]|uniref:Uncharacterized protein n=1 Tax=Leucogyrophana mollusca TaxID=85980 RepID=A0ACB8BCX4_9AGAM|nr:hypothetical protein BV22DRAFT_580619 [Leucogyrophana mollusca]
MRPLYPPFFTATVFLAGLGGAFAQGVASCQPSTGYSWSVNNDGQDPCVVAQNLFAPDPGPCNDTSTTGNTSYYNGPNINTANACLCNTVIYSLAAVCGLCQGGTFVTWTQWTSSCSAGQTVQQLWPATIPNNTEIPPWAYMPLTNGLFDTTGTKQNATAVAAEESSSSVAAASQTASNSASPSPSGGSPPSNNSSSSNTGAIAGGVVGGVAVVAILGFLGFYFWRRRSRNAASQAAPRHDYAEEYSDKPLVSSSYLVPDSQPTFTKLYDPNDPSTFPRSPAPLSQTTQSSEGLSAIAARGQYTGAPEL